ncbi:MAG: hypothetical protein IE931_05555 [Sphingobacteriales bacterium]|nr:hypothetical protein [Sphingobacteriales bacterium]
MANKEELKAKAEAALDYHKHIDAVYVTSDAQVFLGDKQGRNYAIAHAAKLGDKTVERFERDEEENEVVENDKALPAKDVIAMIAKAATVEEVNNLIEGDTRKTVLKASEDKLKDLIDAENKAQAEAAEAAKAEREKQAGNGA